MLLMPGIANTFMPPCRATITSDAVDAPTASHPANFKKRSSALLSNVGPANAPYTPCFKIDARFFGNAHCQRAQVFVVSIQHIQETRTQKWDRWVARNGSRRRIPKVNVIGDHPSGRRFERLIDTASRIGEEYVRDAEVRASRAPAGVTSLHRMTFVIMGAPLLNKNRFAFQHPESPIDHYALPL